MSNFQLHASNKALVKKLNLYHATKLLHNAT